MNKMLMLNCSNQASQQPNDLTLSRNSKNTGNYENREKNLMTEKVGISLAMEKSSPSYPRKTGQKDTKRTQYEKAVLEAYGIVPVQEYFSSFQRKAFDISTESVTAPSNVKAIIDGFLG